MSKLSFVNFLFFVVVTIAALSLVTAKEQLSPVVQTPFGRIQGLKSEVLDGIYSFKGIPFAAPPLGELRFAAPEDPVSWGNVRNATKWAAGCMQSKNGFPIAKIMDPAETSEDCLYLNVYTPTLDPNANLETMVYFYGGDYVGGAGGIPLYEGSELAKNQNMVIVTTNYRLGAIGAWYSPSAGSTGNFHLKDAIKTLEWIQKSIRNFGGNPKSVMITGQSAGASLTTTLVQSSKAAGLFHRAVPMSNPIGIPLLNAELAVDLGSNIAKAVGCPTDGSELQMQCMRNVPAETLFEKGNHASFTLGTVSFIDIFMKFLPVIDGDYVKETQVTALARNRVNNVPIMVSTVQNESVQFVVGAVDKPISCNDTEIMVAIFLNNATRAKLVYEKFRPDLHFKDCRNSFIEPLVSSYLWFCSWRYATRKLAASNPTVPFYRYSFSLSYATWLPWVYNHSETECNPLKRKPENGIPAKGVTCHADDIPMIFGIHYEYYKNAGLPYPPQPPTAEEVHLSHQMQSAWGNFARTNNPNDHTGNPYFAKLQKEKHALLLKSLASGMKDNRATFPFLPRYSEKAAFMNFSIPAVVEYGDGPNFQNDHCDFMDTLVDNEGFPYTTR